MIASSLSPKIGKEIISHTLPLLLLPPSRLSRVLLCATPWTAAYQASPSMGFSRQEHWSGLPFPSPTLPLGFNIAAGFVFDTVTEPCQLA